MTPLLRIEMILISVIMIIIVINSVNKKKMCIQYSLVWIFISLLLLVIAVFPEIVFFLCNILDIQTPSNLIYLAGIFALLLVNFYQTSIISKQSDRIKFLIQTISIEKHRKDMEQKDDAK